MADQAEKRRILTEAIAEGIDLGVAASRVMSPEAAQSYVRDKLTTLAVQSRECARAHDLVAEVIEQGLARPGDAAPAAGRDLGQVVVAVSAAAVECVMAREAWIEVFTGLFRDGEQFSACSSPGGKG